MNKYNYSQYKSVQDLYDAGLLVESKKETEELVDDKPKKQSPIKEDSIKVAYADPKAKPTCIFKHIIFFTNDRSDHNKTLKNLCEAIKDLDVKLHVFVAANADAEEDESKIHLYDDEEEFTLETESNIDTLVISRLGVQNELICEHCVKLLADRGFLILNPVGYMSLACNKLETSKLLEKGNIPQPRYCAMTKDILEDDNLYSEAMKRVYEEFDSKDPNEKLKLVGKILDGHGGTGVFVLNGKNIKSILQAMFAIDPKRTLLIQRREDGDGGDIRVHVLTLKNRQVILGAMKRVQLGGDFRSNVSLGAEAKPIKLTPKQERIALDAAKLSRLPWCAVDIMHLKTPSVDGYNDVVLEMNASPGTSGISDVLGINFINLILNELNDPSEFMLQDKQAGYIETAEINFGSTKQKYLCKLDTGSNASACALEVGDYEESDKTIKFKIGNQELEFEKQRSSNIIAGEEKYTRPVISVPELRLGLRVIKNVRIAIVHSRSQKTTNLLLNRETISNLGYVVNPYKKHLLSPEIERVKIV